jgi:hypothetical protein
MRFTIASLAFLTATSLTAQDRVPTTRDTLVRELNISGSDLRNLVVAQEAYFADHERYAATLEQLRFAPTAGGRLTLTVAKADGWGASLTRPRLPGSCVIFVNLPEAEQPRTARDGHLTAEGAPRCDEPAELRPVAGSTPDVRAPSSVDALRIAMNFARADLRNLVTAQEAYFSQHGKYSRDLGLLSWRASTGSSMKLLVAEDRGWAAEVTRPDLAGNCVVWINLAEDKRPRTSPSGKTARAGEALCDASTPPTISR